MREREFAVLIQPLDQVLVDSSVKMLTNVMGHRIRYPDPAIKVNDTVKLDLSTGKITEFIRFDTGVIAMATGGRNMGRVGVITHRERHDGGFNIVHIKDAIDNSFATRESNVFVIGNEKPWISLPKGKGVKVSRALRKVNDSTFHANNLTAHHCRGKRSPSCIRHCRPLKPSGLSSRGGERYVSGSHIALYQSIWRSRNLPKMSFSDNNICSTRITQIKAMLDILFFG